MWRTQASAGGTARRVLLGFLAVTLLAVGCTSAGSSATTPGPLITVAVVPGADNAPVMIGIKEGLNEIVVKTMCRFHVYNRSEKVAIYAGFLCALRNEFIVFRHSAKKA